jgi:hypothetical protein
MQVFLLLCWFVISQPLTEAERLKFLPTASELSSSGPGTSLTYALTAGPSPDPLGRTVSLRFYHGYCSDFYVREEADHYSCDILAANRALTLRYVDGTDVYWFVAPVSDDQPSFVELIRQKQFACADVPAFISEIARRIESYNINSGNNVDVKRTDEETLHARWKIGGKESRIRIDARIIKDEPCWASSLKAGQRTATATKLERDFTFPQVASRIAAIESEERPVPLGELASASRKSGFVLPKDRSVISRATTLQGGKSLLLNVQLGGKDAELLIYRVNSSGASADLNEVFTHEMVAGTEEWGMWKLFLVREGTQLTKYFANSSGVIVCVCKDAGVDEKSFRQLVESLHEEQ